MSQGIPSALRGLPQIEIQFDIDANGIFDVTAKELGTAMAAPVRIEHAVGGSSWINHCPRAKRAGRRERSAEQAG